MFCPQCGKKALVDSKFCSECGTNFVNHKESAVTAEEHGLNRFSGAESLEGKKRWWLLTLPLTIFFLGSASLWYIFYHETNQNEQSSIRVSSAQQFALEGKWNEAISEYDQALVYHPTNETIKDEKDLMNFALSVEKEIEQIHTYLQEENYEESEKLVNEAHKSLDNRSGKVIELLRAKISEESVLLTIGKVEKELDLIKDYQSVIENIQVLSDLPKEQTDPLRSLLYEKMVNILQQDITGFLEKNQFSDARSTVEKGLSHLPNDETLQTLKQEVEAKKEAFEEQEQKQIEIAKQKAAEEDLLNRTKAIEVTTISIEIEEWGYTIYGTVLSKGTRPLSDINIHYMVTDTDGNYVTDYSVYTTPDVLYPGESASFSMYHFGSYDYLYVETDQINWNIQ